MDLRGFTLDFIFIFSLIWAFFVAFSSGAPVEKSPVMHQRNRRGSDVSAGHIKLFWDDKWMMPPTTHIQELDSVTLTCVAAGFPAPLIHWQKNGITLESTLFRNVILSPTNNPSWNLMHIPDGMDLRVSSTVSNLNLDCLTIDDSATYTCVAESSKPNEPSISSQTVLKVTKKPVTNVVPKCLKSKSVEQPAKITMWTNNSLEHSGNAVRLICRASGFPTPEIIWKRETDHGTEDIHIGSKYQIADNSDLVIQKTDFEKDMGSYVCVAKNLSGTDKKTAFLYPFKSE